MAKQTFSLPAALDFDGNGGVCVGRGSAGWTVLEFADAREAARFVARHPEAALPCWKRFDVVNGQLVQVR